LLAARLALNISRLRTTICNLQSASLHRFAHVP